MYFQPKFTNGINAVPGYGSNPFISGLRITITGSTTFNVSPGSCRAFTSDDVISTSPFDDSQMPKFLTVNINNTGALGCYPVPVSIVSMPDWTNFGVYLLGDTSGKNSPTAIVATGDNFLLPGYNVWRRIGSVFIHNISRELIHYTQSGNSNDRKYLLKDMFGASYGPTTFYPVLMSSLGPTKAPCNSNFVTDGIFARELTPVVTGDYGSITPTNTPLSSPIAPLTLISNVPYVPFRDQIECPVGFNDDGQAVVYVTVSSTVGNTFIVYIAGWKESLGLQAV